MGGWVYILLCADGTFYVGVTSRLWERLGEHMRGASKDSYTAQRLPVRLVWCTFIDSIVDAIAAEKKLKGWSHAKKQALIDGDFRRLKELSQCKNETRSDGRKRNG